MAEHSNMNETATRSNEEESALKITDLNIDCLEKIIESLELIDLVNVADVNEQLREIASSHFSQKHKTTSTYLLIVDRISAYRGLQFLRCFGHTVFDLLIEIRDGQFRPAFGHYANKYCRRSRVEFLLSYDGP